jgi:hypothetical protein
MSVKNFLATIAHQLSTPSSEGETQAVTSPSQGLHETEKSNLGAMLAASRPTLVLYVQQASDGQRLNDVLQLAVSATPPTDAAPCSVLVHSAVAAHPPTLLTASPEISLTWCPPGIDSQALAAHMASQGVQADALVLDADIPATAVSEWLHGIHRLVHGKGWVLGMHTWDAATLRAVEAAAAAQNLHLTFVANVWIATLSAYTLPTLSAPIAGTVESVYFGSITHSVDEVADRSTFLQCVRNGVSAYQRQPGGESFTNRLPVNIAAQNAEVQADYVNLHFPPFKEVDRTEDHLIAHLRDVRIAGVRGYIYSRTNELLEQSYGIGPDSVQAVGKLIPPYEPILRKAVASSDHIHWNTMAGVFPPSVTLNDPHVVAMWPDTYIYHHWMVGCLTRFWYLDAYPELADLPIVMNPFIRRYQFEYMDMLGLLHKNRLVFSNNSVSLKLRHAIYPTQFGMAPHSPQAIHWLRNKFLKHAAKVPVGYENGLYYISRKDGRSREIANEGEILGLLKPYGFQVVEWSAFSVAQQIAMAHHAKVIIGAHGSNMSNTIYINPDCKVLDIRNTQHNGHDLTISAATHVAGGKFYATPTFCPPEHGRLRSNTALDMSHDNHQIDMADFKAVFLHMMDA